MQKVETGCLNKNKKMFFNPGLLKITGVEGNTEVQ